MAKGTGAQKGNKKAPSKDGAKITALFHQKYHLI
jgi:hypothetical protein